MKHTIEKINDEHWIIDSKIDVVYFNTFGRTGWYISKSTGEEPARRDNFINAIEEAIDEYKSKKQVMPPPAGI